MHLKLGKIVSLAAACYAKFDAIRRASISGNADSLRDKNESASGSGRIDDTYLRPRLGQGPPRVNRASYELSWKVKVMTKKKRKRQQ